MACTRFFCCPSTWLIICKNIFCKVGIRARTQRAIHKKPNLHQICQNNTRKEASANALGAQCPWSGTGGEDAWGSRIALRWPSPPCFSPTQRKAGDIPDVHADFGKAWKMTSEKRCCTGLRGITERLPLQNQHIATDKRPSLPSEEGYYTECQAQILAGSQVQPKSAAAGKSPATNTFPPFI